MAGRTMPLWQSVPLWFVLYAAGTAVACLPRRLELLIGSLLGRLALRLDPKRPRIARENIARCLPELSPSEQARLLEANYAHYGILALELLHFFTPLPGHFRRYMLRNSCVDGFEHWQKSLGAGRSAVSATRKVMRLTARSPRCSARPWRCLKSNWTSWSWTG